VKKRISKLVIVAGVVMGGALLAVADVRCGAPIASRETASRLVAECNGNIECVNAKSRVSQATLVYLDSQTSKPTLFQNPAQVSSYWLHYPADGAGRVFGSWAQMIVGLPAMIFDSGVNMFCGPTTFAQQRAALLMTDQEKFNSRILDALFVAIAVWLFAPAAGFAGRIFSRQKSE
jgi:hypothetical protein